MKSSVYLKDLIDRRKFMKEIILRVEGMSCSGCEMRIQNALMEVDGVEKVEASHLNKEVKITLTKEIDENILKQAITDLDFEVIE